MEYIGEILDDQRTIHKVGTDKISWIVGETCDKITAYGEPGLECRMPWLAVFRNNKLVTRINAASVTFIDYED